MEKKTPAAVITLLLKARARGDIESAIACYGPEAAVVVQPGKVMHGQAAIKAFVQASAALNLRFDAHRFIEGDGIALHFSQWSANPAEADSDQSQLAGYTADVLRRQQDATWLIAIDNPWGSRAG